MRQLVLLGSMLVFLLVGCGAENVVVEANPAYDVPYVSDDLGYHELDVYRPESGEGPFPTILAIHGGGFYTRSKSLYHRHAEYFNDLGYAFVSTNYRLSGYTSYPAQVEDVFCALAWVHANHKAYNLDASHVYVMGGSAGGYLAAMLGTVDTPDLFLEDCPHTLPESDPIRGAVIFYGLFDFTSIDGYQPNSVERELAQFWGAAYDDIPPDTLVEMSPMSWVDGTESPFLLIHGTEDGSVPSWMSEEFAAVLEEAGVDVELLLVEAGHAFELSPLTDPVNVQSLAAIEAFTKRISEE